MPRELDHRFWEKEIIQNVSRKRYAFDTQPTCSLQSFLSYDAKFPLRVSFKVHSPFWLESLFLFREVAVVLRKCLFISMVAGNVLAKRFPKILLPRMVSTFAVTILLLLY